MALANTICPDSPRLSSKTASDQARSLILQALDLITEGTLETADLYLQKASKLAPNKPDLQFALGLFHEESGDAAQAQHHYEQAVQLDSCHAQAQINLGLLHGQNQALGQAESCFQNAIAAEPHLPEPHLNLGNILQQTNRLPEAEAAYRCALRVEPTLATGHRNLSSILLWQNRHAEALQHALKAAQHDQVDGETHNALGAIFKATQQIDKAEACFRLALETDRENAAYHTNLAGALVDAGKLNQAQYHYQQAIQLNAMLPDAHHGLGMLQLQTGNLEAGWKNYEWRWQTAQQNKRRHQGKPEWNGESTPDKSLLVYCEQGLGDSIQFVRFLAHAAERVDSIILECPPEAADLFRTVRVESLTIITADRTPPPFDFQIALLSLPKALGATLENIPKGVPYLRPSSQASPIDTQLSSQKLNVGLVWAGNPQHRNDAFRSMQWTDCEPLLETDFAHFVSLQLNASDKVNAAIAKSPNAIDATAHCRDLAATAAIINQLDLVISVDTAMAHLAGALGKPVWLLLPFAGEWRWMTNCDHSPWYPTMKLFRQPKPGDWKTVIQNVVESLEITTLPVDVFSLEKYALETKKNGRLQKARLLFEKILTHDSEHVESISNLGNVLLALGKTGQAIETHSAAQELAPNSSQVIFNRSLALLKTGDFRKGWVGYEHRTNLPHYEVFQSRMQQPKWQGESLAGKTLLVWAEQGLGDTIQFCRFLRLIDGDGGRVLFECPPEMGSLLNSIEGIEVIKRGEHPPQHDLQCALLSLPRIFGTTLETIPEPAGLNLGSALPSLPGADQSKLKIGLAWRGSRRHETPEPREFPAAFLPELTRPGSAQFYSLQLEQVESETAFTRDLILLNESLTDFRATAQFIRQLDLVITIDTAVAHLAGTLGKPTWLLLPFGSEWRWLEHRDDCPWYPSMRLFRQPKPGDWVTVLSTVKEALRLLPTPTAAHHLKQAEAALIQSQAQRAAEQYQLAHEANPKNPLILRLLGNTLGGLGQAEAAQEKLQLALELQPADPENHHELALHFAGLGQAEQAIVSYQRAIELNPACADYHFNLGNAHYALGQAPAARSSFSAATTLDPQLAAAHFNLGQVAQDEGDHLAAAQSYKRAVDLDFHYVDALVNLGLTLKELGQPELTRECFELILQKQTGHPMAGVNLAKFHLEQNHPPAAEAACRSVLEVHPTHAEALLNLGVALQAQNRTLDAIAAYEEIVAHNPDYPDRQFNIAFSELMAGRWQSGWQHYEARWGTDNPVFSPRHPHVQAWNGEPLSGKRLLFFAEQGYGDTLQFCRFAPLLSSAGATVIIECQPGLKSLLESIPNVEQVVEQGEAIPAVDFKLPMMSAPLVFGITPENILNGSDGRYLTAPAAEGICSEGRLKVGLVWSGRERSVLNNRSLPSAMLPELFQQTEGIVEWFSLQKDEPTEAAEIITATLNVTRMGSQITDFESTARLVNAMDLVVTIDTAMAHLAGALGQRTWVMLSHSPDWRWMLQRDDSPWYPNSRLFRQPTAGDWVSVVEQVRAELSRLAGR